MQVQTNFNVVSANTISLTDDDYQRLSFYLHNVNSCVPGLVDQPLRDYKNYFFFSQFTKEEIYFAAIKLKPSLLEGLAFFNTPKPTLELIRPGVLNTHIDLTQKHVLKLSDADRAKGINVTLATQVDRKMLYAPEWMDKNYYIPMANIERRLFGGGSHVSLSVGFGTNTLNQPLRYNPTVNTTVEGFGARDCALVTVFLLVVCAIFYMMYSFAMKSRSSF